MGVLSSSSGRTCKNPEVAGAAAVLPNLEAVVEAEKHVDEDPSVSLDHTHHAVVFNKASCCECRQPYDKEECSVPFSRAPATPHRHPLGFQLTFWLDISLPSCQVQQSILTPFFYRARHLVIGDAGNIRGGHFISSGGECRYRQKADGDDDQLNAPD